MMANEGHKCINEKHLIVMVVEKAAVLNKKFELEKDIENLIRTTLALNRQNAVGLDASKVILFVLFSWCYKVRHCNVNVAKPIPHLAQLDQKNAPSNFTLPSWVPHSDFVFSTLLTSIHERFSLWYGSNKQV